MNVNGWRVIDTIQGSLSPIFVIKKGLLLALSRDPKLWIHNSRAHVSRPQRMYSWYQHAMCIPFLFEPQAILTVGLGAGAMATAAVSVAPAVDCIELDNGMLEAAVKHFSFAHSNRVTLASILSYDPSRQYDLIQLDVSSSAGANPDLYSRKSVAMYKAWLSSNGVLALNLNTRPDIVARLLKNLFSVFGARCVLVNPVPEERVVLCFKSPGHWSLSSLEQQGIALSKNGILALDAFTPVLAERFYGDEFRV